MSRFRDFGRELYTGERSYPFIRRRRTWYAISGIAVVICIAALAIFRLNLGVEFTGGAVFTFDAPGATVSEVRAAVEGEVGGEVIVQQVGDDGWRVQTEPLDEGQDEISKVEDALASELGIDANSISPQAIGPSWGKQITRQALIGLVLFLLAVVVYLSIAFEWQMAAGALVALAHDVIITIGIYAIGGFTVTPATVIGILTILGYSLYDTVVVFDKVKENTRGVLAQSRVTYAEATELAVNQTLVRSMTTSIVALLPVASLVIVGAGALGAQVLFDLGLALLVGMFVGAYSSIFLAPGVLVDLRQRDPQIAALDSRVAARRAVGKDVRPTRRSTETGGTAETASAVGATAVAVEESEGTPDEVQGSSPLTSSGEQRVQPRRTSRSKRRPGGGGRTR